MKTSSTFFLIACSVAIAGCSATATPAKTQTPSTTGTQQNYTLTDVSAHSTASDCWMVISGSVYDVTKFIPQHPGGAQIIRGCGKDATSLFESERKHQGPQTQDLLPQYKIGELTQ